MPFVCVALLVLFVILCRIIHHQHFGSTLLVLKSKMDGTNGESSDINGILEFDYQMDDELNEKMVKVLIFFKCFT